MTDQKKPSKNEDEYFAKLDAELISSTREQERQALEETERHSHYMKCPKDGHDLVTVNLHSIQVENCPHCGGTWLDVGELGALLRHEEPGLIRRVLIDLVTGLRRRSYKESK
jgi:Transcription factor zinc-finger